MATRCLLLVAHLLSLVEGITTTGTYDDDLMAGAFRDGFNEVDRRIFYEMLGVFANISSRTGVTYSLFYGSLLGQHCVGDQLAWDDDGDLVVYDGWDKLTSLAGGLDQYLSDEHKGKYRLVLDPMFKKTNLKLYSVEGTQKLERLDQPWLAPFLDISYLNCAGQACSKIMDSSTYDSHDIFPLQYATFGHLTLPIPRRSKEVLTMKYKVSPCQKAMPMAYDHFLEIWRPMELIEPFMHGIPFELVSRRLSDSVCAQTYPAELPTISLDRRAIYAANAGKKPARLLNRDLCKELHSIEVDNSISKVSPPPLHNTKVVFFNIQRGVHWKESLDHLRGAHIIMLNGVDSGMARTGNMNVARQLAVELRKNYVQAIEFVELSNGLPEERLSTATLSNKKGFLCNAILSDFPLKDSRIVRLPEGKLKNGKQEAEGVDWFQSPTESRTEVRLGSRMALLSKVIVGDKPIWIAVTHLDGTNDQLDASVKAVSQESASGPMIYAGDLHAQMEDVQRRFDTAGLNFDANSAVLSKPTHGYTADSDGKVISKGKDHTHLVGARGVKISDMDIQPPVGPRGELLSNSAFVSFSIVPDLKSRLNSHEKSIMRHEKA